MSSHKHLDKIIICITALALIICLVMMIFEQNGVVSVFHSLGYESKIFDVSRVHTIDIILDNSENFFENCMNEEYSECAVVIDNEAYKNVAIRAKGNTSLTQVSSYGNGRYSFKIEFDHYDESKSYHGLDKLCLNNIVQDNTYMKDYISYRMMNYFGALAPLCSYAYITVNGEDWGLYLAVEGIEDSFLLRNGEEDSKLYKPESANAEGDMMQRTDSSNDRGNIDFSNPHGGEMPFGPENSLDSEKSLDKNIPSDKFEKSDDGIPPEVILPSDSDVPQNNNMPQNSYLPQNGFGMKSNDVALIYTDDDFSSYSNIFDNAKSNIDSEDKNRLIASVKRLNECVDISGTVDCDEVLRYFTVHNFLCNFDSYTGNMMHNYYLLENDGILSMIAWDYNLAFGGFEGENNAATMVNYPIDTPTSGVSISDRPMLSWIFYDAEYTDKYHSYLAELISVLFDSGEFENIINDTIALISPYVEKDPKKFCTYEEFEKGANTLKEFCILRAESISKQLQGDIPSTSEGQNKDSNSLLDASSIDLSDMGKMNVGFDDMTSDDRMSNMPETMDDSKISVRKDPIDKSGDMCVENSENDMEKQSDVSPNSGDFNGMPPKLN